MQETYKDILGYENLYQVSNLGNVKSLPKSDGNGNRERLLKLEVCAKNHTSYYRVSLSKNGVVNRYQVHQLVAQAFIQNLDGKPLVNHIDNNPSNNQVCNLEWCTAKENRLHAATQNRLPRLSGENNGNAKYTARLINIIRSRHKNGMTQTDIAKMFNIPQPTVSVIVRKIQWRNI